MFLPWGRTDHRHYLGTSGAGGYRELTSPCPAPREGCEKEEEEARQQLWAGMRWAPAAQGPGALGQAGLEARGLWAPVARSLSLTGKVTEFPKYLLCSFSSAHRQVLVPKCQMQCYFDYLKDMNKKDSAFFFFFNYFWFLANIISSSRWNQELHQAFHSGFFKTSKHTGSLALFTQQFKVSFHINVAPDNSFHYFRKSWRWKLFM